MSRLKKTAMIDHCRENLVVHTSQIHASALCPSLVAKGPRFVMSICPNGVYTHIHTHNTIQKQ